MLTYRVTPEVGTVMSACEELFSRVLMVGGLTTLDKEILEYYSAELQKHLQLSPELTDPKRKIEIPVGANTMLRGPTTDPIIPSVA